MRTALARAGAAAGVLTIAAAASSYAAAPGQAGTLTLPKPQGQVPLVAEAFPDRPERARKTYFQGRVDDTGRVDVLVGPSGAPAVVTMTQRLVLHGNGPYIVWERSSAQDVEALDDTPAPVLKREAVVWQGFSPGRRELAAKLTLDPAVEAELLPLGIELEWRGNGAIAPGGALPGPGEVVVRLTNRTSRPVTLPTGEVTANDVAGPLDVLLAHANAKKPGAPPAAGARLPETIPATRVGKPVETTAAAPFRVTGTIRVNGGAPGGDETPAVRHLADGIALDGVLQGGGEFTVRANGPSTLSLDLTAYPTVDPRMLVPPRGKTWADWLRVKPTPNETQAALRTLVEAMASTARGHDYVPYLGRHGRGDATTTYHVAMAPAEAMRVVAKPLRPKAFPIALAGVALLGVLANGTAIWRRL